MPRLQDKFHRRLGSVGKSETIIGVLRNKKLRGQSCERTRLVAEPVRTITETLPTSACASARLRCIVDKGLKVPFSQRLMPVRFFWPDAIAFSWTVVSTFTHVSCKGLSSPDFIATWSVTSSIFSRRSARKGFRHRLRLEGSIGHACCISANPQKDCIGIFNPPRYDRLIALMEDMLQIKQPDHQSRSAVRTDFVRIACVDKIVDSRRQNYQGVVRVENLFQGETAQTSLRIRAMELHVLRACRNLRIS